MNFQLSPNSRVYSSSSIANKVLVFKSRGNFYFIFRSDVSSRDIRRVHDHILRTYKGSLLSGFQIFMRLLIFLFLFPILKLCSKSSWLSQFAWETFIYFTRPFIKKSENISVVAFTETNVANKIGFNTFESILYMDKMSTRENLVMETLDSLV